MPLWNLPEDILTIVLRECAGVTVNAAPTLKHRLPLLAVCRYWRRVAIPLVYNHVFVQYGERSVHEADPFPRSLDADEPINVAVMTNLDLITMVGCSGAVKRVKIDVHFLANPLPGWWEVTRRLRAVARRWSALELTVMTYQSFHHVDSRNVDMAKYADGVAEVGDGLAAMMPGVRDLTLGGGHDNPIGRLLYGRLARHYVDQLGRLSCRHPMPVPRDCQFTRLKIFHMWYDEVVDYQLPQVATRELVDMKLSFGHVNHSWGSLGADSDPRTIEFTNLKRLTAVYFSSRHDFRPAGRRRGGHPWLLHFPSLKILDIRSMGGNCPLLEYAVLPPRMDFIMIRMELAAFQDHANLVLPATKRLSLQISGHRGDRSGFPIINQLLKRARVSQSLGLSIDDRGLPVAPDNITCTSLTHLTVSAGSSVDTMLAFIKRLPKLSKLTFHNVYFSNIQADMSIPEANEDTAVAPLHTSLDGIAIGHDKEQHSLDTAVAVVKYLLLRIPTLARIHALQTPKSPVIDFVEAYAARYPHLSRVKLQLDDSRNSVFTRSGFDV